MLALRSGPPVKPKRLRLRIFASPGVSSAGGCRLRMRIAKRWPWALDLTAAADRLHALAPG